MLKPLYEMGTTQPRVVEIRALDKGGLIGVGNVARHARQEFQDVQCLAARSGTRRLVGVVGERGVVKHWSEPFVLSPTPGHCPRFQCPAEADGVR